MVPARDDRRWSGPGWREGLTEDDRSLRCRGHRSEDALDLDPARAVEPLLDLQPAADAAQPVRADDHQALAGQGKGPVASHLANVAGAEDRFRRAVGWQRSPGRGGIGRRHSEPGALCRGT